MDITQLEASARVRDDLDAQRQFAEIRLRACIRIGEISRELETHQGRHSGTLLALKLSNGDGYYRQCQRIRFRVHTVSRSR